MKEPSVINVDDNKVVVEKEVNTSSVERLSAYAKTINDKNTLTKFSGFIFFKVILHLFFLI